MGMVVYKMFQPGLVCRGYQFHPGVNECEHATCVKEGFHAAENPLDCLSYYGDFDGSECHICYADGDVHEDGSDSKISCTRLEIHRRLGKEEFLVHALRFMAKHPRRPLSPAVSVERGEVSHNGFVVVRGKDPLARGKHIGDYLAFAEEDPAGTVSAVGLYRVDGEEIFPGLWYDICGTRREAVVCG